MGANPNIKDSDTTEFNRLLDQLLAEPFAVSQHLEDATLDSLLTSLEEVEEALSGNSPPPELLALKDSYEKCKELFCLVLMEVEKLNWRLGTEETLYDLRHREAGTTLITPEGETSRHPVPPPAEEDPPETDTLIFEPLNLSRQERPPAPEPPVPPPAPEAAGLFQPLGEDDSGPGEDATLLWAEDVAPAVDIPTLNSDDKAPEPPPPVEPPPAPEPAAVVEAEPPPAPEPVESAEPEGNIDPFYFPLTQEYLALAQHFRAEANRVPRFHRDRFEGQALIFAVEAEAWLRLKTALEAFWPKKEAACRELMPAGVRRADFHPLLRRSLEALARDHEAWLPEGRFPFVAALNVLRFFLTSPPWEAFEPLPVEAAVLLLLFGQDRNLNGIVLRNFLDVQGLTEEEHTELCFRLMRCQRLRNRVLSPIQGAEGLETLREDAERVLALLTRLRAGPGSRGDRS